MIAQIIALANLLEALAAALTEVAAAAAEPTTVAATSAAAADKRHTFDLRDLGLDCRLRSSRSRA
jgi:hypothetical protein